MPRIQERIIEAGIVLCLSIALLAANIIEASAETAHGSWLDPNYALCDGIGATASGRVDAHAEYKKTGGILTITSLSFSTIGHQHEHSASGRITYQDESGTAQTVLLQKPWFDVIRPTGPGESLFLPRVMTSSSGPSPAEQMTIAVTAGTAIDITLRLVFGVDGGNCPTSFDESWTIE